MEWYKQNQVAIVAKDINPPNCPQLRPIEKYWAIVKRFMMKSGAPANTNEQMLRKWNLNAGKVTDMGVQKLMENIKQKVRYFYENDDY